MEYSASETETDDYEHPLLDGIDRDKVEKGGERIVSLHFMRML